MISEMPGPICVRLSGIVGGRWEIVLGPKKFQNIDVEKCGFFFVLSQYFQPNPI